MALDESLREQLLAEIDGGVGVDGREDEGAAGETFRELRFQRKAVFRAEQKAAMGAELGGDETWSWDTLLEVSRDYLAESSKDLEAAAIFLESSTRVEGLSGLVDGTGLIADLIARYWEAGLYPAEDEEDGVEARFQPLSGLSGGGSDKEGTLVGPIRRMVIAGDAVNGELRYMDRVTADGQLTTAQSTTPEQRKALTAEAEAALEAIEALVRRLPRAQVDAALAQIGAAEAAWRRAVSFISERTKPRFPATSKVSDELRSLREWLEGLIRLLPEVAPIMEDEPEAATAEEGVVVNGGGAARGPFSIGRMATREDALKAINAAADFFDKHEPLSPIGGSLREIDRRAKLSFAELLTELIPDNSPRETFYWRSGIKPPAPA